MCYFALAKYQKNSFVNETREVFVPPLSKDKKNFEVVLLSANQNFKLLLKQAKEFKPKYIYANNIFLENKIDFFIIYQHSSRCEYRF